MANQKIRTYRQVKIVATVQTIDRGDSYSYNTDELASSETTVRLGGMFDRHHVAILITNIVNQLVSAFDEGEGPQDVDPVEGEGPQDVDPVEGDL